MSIYYNKKVEIFFKFIIFFSMKRILILFFIIIYLLLLILINYLSSNCNIKLIVDFLFILSIIIIIYITTLYDLLPKKRKNIEIYKIYTLKEFMNNIEPILNHSLRFNLKPGFIIIHFSNLTDIEKNFKKNELKFIRKQINFLLTNNSRDYEPWGRDESKTVYVKILETKNEKETELAGIRFYNIIKNHDFYIYEKKVDINFKIISIIIKDINLKESNVLEIKEKIKNILINYIKKIKDLKVNKFYLKEEYIKNE